MGWFGLVWFSVPIKVNGKILIPTTHFVHSALFVVVVFATSNCRHITNTKSKNIFHYRKEKSSCFSVPDRVKTQCCTLVISGKGVVNFSKWICGSGREFNVCVIPSPIQRIK